MSMGNNRWHSITPSEFPWEREALDWLRAQLPNRDPWYAWSNFEFIDSEGRISEVDLLVLSPAGLFLVEIKSRPGLLDGDESNWTWHTDGRTYTSANPLLLANRKAKRLASLLRQTQAITKAKSGLPFIEPLIFLSHCDNRLKGRAKAGTYGKGQPGSAQDDGILSALSQGLRPAWQAVDGRQAKDVARALQEVGVRAVNHHRQVGDYHLQKLLEDCESWQDWLGQHISLPQTLRRIRLYNVAQAASKEERTSRSEQAVREFKVLDGINHSGILKVNDYKESEHGPALVFDYDPSQFRLDQVLTLHARQFTVSQRLQLVRDLAETLQYAHSKRLYHRALSPHSILLTLFDGTSGKTISELNQLNASTQLQARIMNWQLSTRDAANHATLHRTTGTRHIEEHVEEAGKVYLAPETAHASPEHGAKLDIFALGALAYHIFSGQAPANNVSELAEKLRIGQGLRLSDVMDGAGPHLQDLIQYATSPDSMARYASAREFLHDLEEVEDELTAPAAETTVDPAIAGKNDRLEGGFTVIKRMGRGSSADVLLVRVDGNQEQEYILKVASKVAHNERLLAEGEVLAKIHHQNIVAHLKTLQVAGRSALLLRYAGENTLAQEIKQQGRLALDMLRRFGEELIQAVAYLEDEGIAHRDIKPDNIGIGTARSSKKKQLTLFDFSLCLTPAENIHAGTHPYLDPFLSLRKPPRWDLYAERYALAITLYEMAVGKPPKWGDGNTAPALMQEEVSLAREVFDPGCSEGLYKFFQRALKRDYRARHDNAEHMLQEWRAIFSTPQTLPQLDGFTALAQSVNAETTMPELGYSLEAQSVLEKMGVHNVRQLLAVDRIKFRYLRGVADRVRKEIRLKAKELARLRPDLVGGTGTLHEQDEALADEKASVDELVKKLLPKRPAGDDNPDELALMHYLGLDTGDGGGDGNAEDNPPQPAQEQRIQAAELARRISLWPSLGQVAQARALERESLAAALLKARKRWEKTPAITELRKDLLQLLQEQGQVMAVHEMAQAILTLRGCALKDEQERLQEAHAVLRAALEAEAQMEEPRFEYYPHPLTPMLATHPARVEYARQLGAAADACAQAQPLLPGARALEVLRAIQVQGGVQREEEWTDISDNRLLRLASAAANNAALSSRLEFYPRKMAAVDALRQSLGALSAANLVLSVQALQERVAGRYPLAAALPPRPKLDRLLQEVGTQLTWQDEANHGRGAYCNASLGDSNLSTGTQLSSTHSGPAGKMVAAASAWLDEQSQIWRELEHTFTRKLQAGGLLVLQVKPQYALEAEQILLQRHAASGLRRLNFDALLLQEMKNQARANGVDWQLVLRADASATDSRDWLNLQRLVQRCLPRLQQELLHASQPLLVCHAGLMVRYGLLALLTQMEQECGQAAAPSQTHTPALWLLLASPHSGLPQMDRVALPLTSTSRSLHLPSAWIEAQRSAPHPV